MKSLPLAFCSALAVGALAEMQLNRSESHLEIKVGGIVYYSNKFVDGGCATDTQAFPPGVQLSGISDVNACAQECVNRIPECSAFDFCSGSNCKGTCKLYALDPTKSNHYPTAECHYMIGSNLYGWQWGYLKGGCATQEDRYPPKMLRTTTSGHMQCEALCDADHNCGSYDFLATDNSCHLMKYDQKITRLNGDPKPATCHSKKINNARGEWREVGSVANGGVSRSISVGSETTDGKEVSSELGASVSEQVTASCEFEGLGVDATMTEEASVSTTNSISESLTKSITETTTATCDPKDGHRATLYQWWVETDQSKSYTENYRCHYTTDDKQAPQCPYGFCGDLGTNPLCSFASCSPWQKTAGQSVVHAPAAGTGLALLV